MLNIDEVRPPSLMSRQAATRVVNRNRVADRVARQIAQSLLEARLPEGTRLPPESELCTTMGCSRTGLRSALHLLESWGLVAIQTGRNGGPVVRYPGVSDLKETMSVLFHSERATLADILMTRRAIDPIIAAAAAAHVTPEHLARIDAILERIKLPTLTQRDFLLATAEYQAVIADASKLVILGIFLRTLTSFGEGSVLQRLPFDADYAQQVRSALSRIRDALAAHDPERAGAEMLILRHESEQHWQSQGEPLLNMPLRPFEFGR